MFEDDDYEFPTEEQLLTRSSLKTSNPQQRDPRQSSSHYSQTSWWGESCSSATSVLTKENVEGKTREEVICLSDDTDDTEDDESETSSTSLHRSYALRTQEEIEASNTMSTLIVRLDMRRLRQPSGSIQNIIIDKNPTSSPAPTTFTSRIPPSCQSLYSDAPAGDTSTPTKRKWISIDDGEEFLTNNSNEYIPRKRILVQTKMGDELSKEEMSCLHKNVSGNPRNQSEMIGSYLVPQSEAPSESVDMLLNIAKEIVRGIQTRTAKLCTITLPTAISTHSYQGSLSETGLNYLAEFNQELVNSILQPRLHSYLGHYKLGFGVHGRVISKANWIIVFCGVNNMIKGEDYRGFQVHVSCHLAILEKIGERMNAPGQSITGLKGYYCVRLAAKSPGRVTIPVSQWFHKHFLRPGSWFRPKFVPKRDNLLGKDTTDDEAEEKRWWQTWPVGMIERIKKESVAVTTNSDNSETGSGHRHINIKEERQSKGVSQRLLAALNFPHSTAMRSISPELDNIFDDVSDLSSLPTTPMPSITVSSNAASSPKAITNIRSSHKSAILSIPSVEHFAPYEAFDFVQKTSSITFAEKTISGSWQNLRNSSSTMQTVSKPVQSGGIVEKACINNFETSALIVSPTLDARPLHFEDLNLCENETVQLFRRLRNAMEDEGIRFYNTRLHIQPTPIEDGHGKHGNIHQFIDDPTVVVKIFRHNEETLPEKRLQNGMMEIACLWRLRAVKNVLSIIGVVLGDPVEDFPQIVGIVSPRYQQTLFKSIITSIKTSEPSGYQLGHNSLHQMTSAPSLTSTKPLHTIPFMGNDPKYDILFNTIFTLARTIEEIHHHGICHLDIFPSNIMLTSLEDGKSLDDILRVIDFGSARIIRRMDRHNNRESNITDLLMKFAGKEGEEKMEREWRELRPTEEADDGYIFLRKKNGHAFYRPPELLFSKELIPRVDPRKVDMWCVGIIVCFLLTEMTNIGHVVNDVDLRRLVKSAEDIEEYFETSMAKNYIAWKEVLVKGLLTWDPRQRWSASELVEWLTKKGPVELLREELRDVVKKRTETRRGKKTITKYTR